METITNLQDIMVDFESLSNDHLYMLIKCINTQLIIREKMDEIKKLYKEAGQIALEVME